MYCCYAEKCGTERVSVLNPASFGKLVRIIFPNVQTRRLGVRGESKYHYVDLTVIEEKQQKHQSLDSQAPSNASVPPENRAEDALSKRYIGKHDKQSDKIEYQILTRTIVLAQYQHPRLIRPYFLYQQVRSLLACRLVYRLEAVPANLLLAATLNLQ